MTPLLKRPLDLALVAFFAVNLVFITYMVDLEQLLIADPAHFDYPLWPPALIIDQVHWWGRNFDPALMARPMWWKATIWIDVLFFGPFYALAIYALVKGRGFIRVPAVIWASVMMTNVTIIMFEEVAGSFATPRLGVVAAANAAWFVFPILTIYRMGKTELA